MLCSAGELGRAVKVINDSFAASPLSTGCRIESGLQMIRSALDVLPPTARAEVILSLIARFGEDDRAPMTGSAPGLTPQPLISQPHLVAAVA